jgi:hypothetical protein
VFGPCIQTIPARASVVAILSHFACHSELNLKILKERSFEKKFSRNDTQEMIVRIIIWNRGYVPIKSIVLNLSE